MRAIKLVFTAAVFLFTLSSAAVQAQALPPKTKVTDPAMCQNINVKKNVDKCKACIAGGHFWTTGSGCSNHSKAAAAPAKAEAPKHTPPPNQLKPGTKVTDAAACQHIKVKKNVDACKACVASGKPWVTGSGCSKS